MSDDEHEPHEDECDTCTEQAAYGSHLCRACADDRLEEDAADVGLTR